MAEELGEKLSALYREGKHEEARKLLEEAAQTTPSTGEEYLRLGTALRMQGKLKEALWDFNKAVELSPPNLEALMLKGHTLLNLDRAQEALAVFEEVVVLDPDNEDAYHSKGNALIALNRHEEALDLTEELAARYPNRCDFWNFHRAAVLNQLNRSEEALGVLNKINGHQGISPFPSYSYYLTKAVVLTTLSRFDEALEALAQGMKVTQDEGGCTTCFTGNVWRGQHLEVLRKPPYRERFEKIFGPPPPPLKKV